MMFKLEMKNVTKTFGDTTAVDDLSFSCREGETIVLLGPTGAGKTTTLRTIAGLEDVDRGEILLDGEAVNHLPPEQREIAMFFENYALYSHMTVGQNIAYPLKAPIRRKQFNARAVKQRTLEVARLLQIEELLDRKPSQLSGGQKQRTALGRTLIRNPKVFLLDEPIAHLDAVLRHRMRGEMKKIFKHLNVSVIYVTHDYREALSIGDRIIVLDKGRMIQIGNNDDIYNKMDNIFIARMVGDPPMNIMDGTIRRENGHWLVQLEHGQVVFTNDVEKLSDWNGRAVKLGIRPHDVEIVDREDSNTIPATLIAIEPMSSKYENTLQLPSEDLFKVKSSKNYREWENQQVWLKLNAERLHLFASESGEAIYHGKEL